MFPTTKVARVRSWPLVIINALCVVASITYVVVYMMLHEGAHLKDNTAISAHTISLWAPHRLCEKGPSDECPWQYSEMAVLGYCNQSNLYAEEKKECLPPKLPGLMDSNVARVPLRKEAFRIGAQEGNATPYQGRPQSDLVRPTVEQAEHFELVHDYFVADVEQTLVVISHQVDWTPQDAEPFIPHDRMEGFLKLQPWQSKGEPILCLQGHEDWCPKADIFVPPQKKKASLFETTQLFVTSSGRMKRARARAIQTEKLDDDEDTADYAGRSAVEYGKPLKTKWGDVVSFRTLLRLVGRDLDEPLDSHEGWTHHQYSKGASGAKTLRSCGCKILLELQYDNRMDWIGFHVTPWKNAFPWYEMKATLIPTPCNIDVEGDSTEFSRTRWIEVVLVQDGTVKVWNTMGTLITLAVCATMVGFASALLDAVLLRFAWFQRVKYEDHEQDEEEQATTTTTNDENRAQC